MGYIAIGSFSEGWTLLDGEPLPSDPEDTEGVEDELPQYKRGPRSPRLPSRSAMQAEVDNRVERAASALTVGEAFEAAGLAVDLIPIPEPEMSVACREGRHWAPERPDGSCHGKRLTDDYEWKPCECPVCHRREVNP